ncbi:hemerythrin domain-containing protein [Paraburkholderia caffeinilytica]|uniref:hemerythrin domain-containing protein n=1 Tax=Paraburkholderia caffeinilytica TaxID=1761016 RepID=UPI0038BBE479
MYCHLLVPVDGTDASVEALGQAVEFAQSIGARITFCPLPAGPDASCPEAEADGLAQRTDGDVTWELLARAEAAARAQGVPCSLALPDVGAPTPVASTARAHGCDLICVAPRRLVSSNGTSAHGATTIDGGNIAVLTCAVDSRPTVIQAIGILLAGQRTIAAHLHAALRAARMANGLDRHCGAASLQEIASHLRELQRSKHHSMTEALFARLRAHTSAVDAELDELGRRHQRATQILDELTPLIARHDESAATGLRLEESLRACAQFTWENMGRKEGVVLPAARRYLSDADWNALARAFDSGSADEPPHSAGGA